MFSASLWFSFGLLGEASAGGGDLGENPTGATIPDIVSNFCEIIPQSRAKQPHTSWFPSEETIFD
jgi:hypothetical protein